MKNVIVAVVALVVVFYAGSQFLTMYKAKGDLGDRIERALDFVEANNQDKVAQDLVTDGQKLGLKLTTDNIHITYEDTDIQSYAQQLVGGKLGAQFKNKRVEITARYTAYVVGLPFSQEIIKFKIRQVEAPRMPPSKEAQQILDSQ